MKERIFKLIDREGFIEVTSSNRVILVVDAIEVNGDYYLKGKLDILGHLVDDTGCILIHYDECKYFEEVDSIPCQVDSLPKKETTLGEGIDILKDEMKNLHEKLDIEEEGFVLSTEDSKTSLAERVYNFAKTNNLTTSYDGENDYFVVLILDIDYKVNTIEELDKIETMFKIHQELMIN